MYKKYFLYIYKYKVIKEDIMGYSKEYCKQQERYYLGQIPIFNKRSQNCQIIINHLSNLITSFSEVVTKTSEAEKCLKQYIKIGSKDMG